MKMLLVSGKCATNVQYMKAVENPIPLYQTPILRNKNINQTVERRKQNQLLGPEHPLRMILNLVSKSDAK